MRLTSFFVAICMALIATSLGAALYFVAGFSGAESMMVAMVALTGLGLYNTMSARVRDRTDIAAQIADLSRGTADMGRQMAELGRRLAAAEVKVGTAVDMAVAAAKPVAAEIEELGALIKQLAETVALHDIALGSSPLAPTSPGTSDEAANPPGKSGSRLASKTGSNPGPDSTAKSTSASTSLSKSASKSTSGSTWASAARAAGTAAPDSARHRMNFAELEPEPEPAYTKLESGPFKGMERDDVSAMLLSAIEANRLDLYLQPMVTLPQRKVRFYEALTRLRTGEGAILTPSDFLPYAEEAGLMPRIDNLMLFRCVQVMRRLQAKNREIGMFCNVSASTLIDPEFFPQFSEFMDANRALAPSLVLEFTQAAYRSFGPMENESLAALAGRGFRFSMDNVTDLRLEPRDLGDRGFRFLKVPAALLLDRTGATVSDIHPADLSGLLLRFGVELVGEKIESEGVVVDLLDYDVKYGQGFLFSPPRPVRAEIMQAIPDRSEAASRALEPPKSEPAKPTPPETAPVRSPVAADARPPAAARAAGLGQLARSAPARS